MLLPIDTHPTLATLNNTDRDCADIPFLELSVLTARAESAARREVEQTVKAIAGYHRRHEATLFLCTPWADHCRLYIRSVRIARIQAKFWREAAAAETIRRAAEVSAGAAAEKTFSRYRISY